MFLPTTRDEMRERGWDRLDVILVTGDAYIDSPYVGVAMIGRVLEDAGYRVGVIGQPDVESGRDIGRLGEPALFWGVTGGCVDSLVANRTATRKWRKQDDYTPGGVNDRRPDRAVIAYANLIRRHFKPTAPIVLGGLEASLRRISHYDFWSNRVRRSILFDARADLLVYGMGEKAILEVAARLKDGRDASDVRGVCHIAAEAPGEAVELPPHEQAAADPAAFTEMFREFRRHCDAVNARQVCQRQDTRWLVQNPPSEPLAQPELDRVHDLPYERAAHPVHAAEGEIRALDTIRFSLSVHRGCYGDCNFCAIASHQGRTVQWRSEESILAEARAIAALPDFKGSLLDVGGPTANMYGFECEKKLKKGPCRKKGCLFPETCAELNPDHSRQLALLRALRRVPGVKHVFVASGIRYDLILSDEEHGRAYLDQLVRHHVSGQLKIAPEHVDPEVLRLMGKPSNDRLLSFREMFLESTRAAGKNQFLTYYLIAAHPGCGTAEMRTLKAFATRDLKLNPEQVQVFTPLPSTWSAVMYHTGRDPFTGEEIFVEKDLRRKEAQKEIVVRKGKGARR